MNADDKKGQGVRVRAETGECAMGLAYGEEHEWGRGVGGVIYVRGLFYLRAPLKIPIHEEFTLLR